MRVVDDVVLDPEEVSEGRTELNLSEMGLSVLGADWGEAAMEATAIRTGLGQQLVDRKPKPRTIVFDLQVREDAEADLPTAAYLLQQKYGTMATRGGWIRRDFIYGNFAGSVLYHVTGEVTLDKIGGWQAGDGNVDPTLSFVCNLVGYSTEEREQGPFTSAAGARHLEFTEDPSPGTGDGLWRGRFTNEGEEDWRGLILSRECYDAPEDLSDPTAQMAYLAKNLTVRGGAEVKTVSGAEVVQHTELTSGWLTVLSSEISGIGHMTHKGPRPMWMRIFDPGSEPGGVQLRLLTRALGASRWDESLPIVATSVIGGWMPVFLGVARPEAAVLGDERWEWRLMARALSGSGAIRIRDVYPLSAEQYCVSVEPPSPSPPDEQAMRGIAGVAEGLEGFPGTEWGSPNNAKEEGGAPASLTLSEGETSARLILRDFGFPLFEDATFRGVVLAVNRSGKHSSGERGISDSLISLVVEGEPLGANRAQFSIWPSSQAYAYYGGSSDGWGISLSPTLIHDPGFGVVIAARNAGKGDLAASLYNVQIGVYYTMATQEDRVCFAGRSLELRSSGLVRQAPDGEWWGALVPDAAQLPWVPAGGLEGRPTRTIAIPSVGDFKSIPDASMGNSLGAETHSRDGYHYSREAA